jgi:adenosylcobinamide kinase/adenosylcobinamide-phosphate guanylyltransferase
MNLILVTGGARSGKSTFAEFLARRLGGDDVCYLATAEAGDDEMRERIAAHRVSRPGSWLTVEAPRNAALSLQGLATSQVHIKVVLLDCLTLLVSNLLLAHPEAAENEAWKTVEVEVSGLIGFAQEGKVALIVVTNEVGLGIVPATRLVRLYRDLLGRANQRLAASASAVYLMVSGVPVEIKALAAREYPEFTTSQLEGK